MPMLGASFELNIVFNKKSFLLKLNNLTGLNFQIKEEDSSTFGIYFQDKKKGSISIDEENSLLYLLSYSYRKNYFFYSSLYIFLKDYQDKYIVQGDPIAVESLPKWSGKRWDEKKWWNFFMIL